MKCNGCSESFDKDEIDDSGFCYDCANYDQDPKPDLMVTVATAARSAFEKIVKRIGRKVDSGQSN